MDFSDLFDDFIGDGFARKVKRAVDYEAEHGPDPTLMRLASEMHKLIGAAKQVVTDLEQQTSSAHHSG